MAVLVSPPTPVRTCPHCRRSPLREVEGGLGKMGQCTQCGYTGPLFYMQRQAVNQ